MQKGFSLVELSIVLVILGLLVGGILAGQSLIRAAELRAVTSEYQRYVTATYAFRDRYLAIPGDMVNATRFWGRMNSAADCITTSSASVVSTGSCDGNGDGTIDGGASGAISVERFQYWRQLSLAGLIDGSYSGMAGTANDRDSTLGTNTPRSKLNNAGWWLVGLPGVTTGSTDIFTYSYGNALTFGGAVTNDWPYAAALKPEEAWNIDTKIDDGKPGAGKLIIRYRNNACAVSTSATDYNATYNLSSTALQCALYFTQVF